jgi:hypothetical protein
MREVPFIFLFLWDSSRDSGCSLSPVAQAVLHSSLQHVSVPSQRNLVTVASLSESLEPFISTKHHSLQYLKPKISLLPFISLLFPFLSFFGFYQPLLPTAWREAKGGGFSTRELLF